MDSQAVHLFCLGWNMTTMRYAHMAPHTARDALWALDRAHPPAVAPSSAPTASSALALPARWFVLAA